ncbi:hypothetical protein K2X89_15245 [Myxococcota bacterium]|nr:hypothetical protein [Myxococcota bacterium]
MPVEKAATAALLDQIADQPEATVPRGFGPALDEPKAHLRTFELGKLLPVDTPKVDREARAAEIAMRGRHAARRWAP